MKQKIPRRTVNGILLFDKPLGLSSNDALQRVKRLYRAEKAGHTGSLDPLATGLLPICFGQATKLCGYLLDSDKTYLAQLRFGEQTATGDAEGEVIARSDGALLTRAALEQVLPGFLGRIRQVPPMYSALKQQGQRLYELARQGVSVEREAREVEIFELRLLSFENSEAQLHVRCSKGTYIRTLAEDIALAAGQVAHLTALRRTQVAPFNSAAILTWDALEIAASRSDAVLDSLLQDAVTAISDWPLVHVDDVREHQLARGLPVRVAGAPRSTRVAIMGPGGRLIAVGEADDAGQVASRRWLLDATPCEKL